MTNSINQTVLDQIFNQTISGIGATVERNFADFVGRSESKDWIIATDFCIGDINRVNNVFAYSVFPDGQKFDKIRSTISAIIPTDFKNVRKLNNEMIAYLRGGPHFTFCFTLSKSGKLFSTRQEANLALDHSIAMVQTWPGSDRNGGILSKLRRLRQKMIANSFSIRRLEIIVFS